MGLDENLVSQVVCNAGLWKVPLLLEGHFERSLVGQICSWKDFAPTILAHWFALELVGKQISSSLTSEGVGRYLIALRRPEVAGVALKAPEDLRSHSQVLNNSFDL